MAWDYLSRASSNIVPWWNFGHVGAVFYVDPHWFCATIHWLALAPP